MAMSSRFWVKALLLPSVAALAGMGCEPDLDATRDTSAARGTFGQIIYQEACQRIAYTAQLDEGRGKIDVDNSVYGGPVCLDDQLAPADAPEKLKAVQKEKSALVRVVDAVLPDPFLVPLENFLEAIEVLDDDGTMEATITSAGDLLQTMADDPAFAPALSRTAGRVGYRPTRVSAGLPRAVLGFSQIDDTLDGTMGLFLDDKGRIGPELTALLDTLSHELRAGKALPNPSDPARTLRLALGLLFSNSKDAGGATPHPIALRDARGVVQIPLDANGKIPAPFGDKNGDFMPDVDGHGRLLAADGKPAQIGAPFLPPGEKDPPGAMRDAQGRLYLAKDRPAYAYLDLDGTVLAALLREQFTLTDPTKDDLLGLFHGATGLLGARRPASRDYKDAAGKSIGSVKYSGFDPASSSLLDLGHAFVQLLGAPRSRELLSATQTLLDKYEDPASRAVAAMLDASDRGKKATSAQIPATSNLFDELMPIVVRILRTPGLLEDLMDALADRHVLGLGPMLAQQFLYKDRFVLDQNFQDVNGKWGTPVDHGKPDVDWNRSVMQRMAHLIHDANGVQFCNKEGATVLGIPFTSFHRCDMFRVDDLGLFFALTIADRSITDDKNRKETTRNVASFREAIQSATLKSWPFVTDDGAGDNQLQTLTGISGFTRFPTPMAAARSLFLDTAHQSSFMQNSIDPVVCGDGDRFIEVHNDSIFAWEQPLAGNPSGYANDTFYDAVRPVINAFARHDECASYDMQGNCTKYRNAAKIFVDVVSVLHEHYASAQSSYAGHTYQSTDPKKPRFSTTDNLRTYEPLLGDVLGNSDLMPAILNLAPTLNSMTIDGAGGPQAKPVIADVARFVFDPARAQAAGVTYRDGHSATVMSDGKTPVPRASLYYVLADSFAAKRAQLAAAPSDKAGAWRAASSDLVDEMLGTETVMGAHRLKNRRLHGATLALLEFLKGRLDAHAGARDLDAWVKKNLIADLSDSIAGPSFAALADFTAKLETDPTTLREMYALLHGLFDDATGGALPATLTAMGDQLQLFLDDANLVPIAHTVGVVIDPARIGQTLAMMKRARALDPNKPGNGKHATLVTLLRNFYQDTPNGSPPIADLGDAIGEIHRAQPGAGTDFEADDYRHLFGEIRTFLVDEERGFMKLVRIVQKRRAPAP